MLITIILFGLTIICYLINNLVWKDKRREGVSQMSENQEQARCSSSDSDNFEKINSEDVRHDENADPVNFKVGDEDADPDPGVDDGPAHEGRDVFPNAPKPNIRRPLTVAQQLALAEKRSKLRYTPLMDKATDFFP